jgi:hypothetical protein
MIMFISFTIFFYTFLDVPTGMYWFSLCLFLGIFKISFKTKIILIRYKNYVFFLQNKIPLHIVTSYTPRHQLYVYGLMLQLYLYTLVYYNNGILKLKSVYKFLYSVCELLLGT